MMSEIYSRGPIACDIDATILETYKDGIIPYMKNETDVDHVIAIVGWGEE